MLNRALRNSIRSAHVGANSSSKTKTYGFWSWSNPTPSMSFFFVPVAAFAIFGKFYYGTTNCGDAKSEQTKCDDDSNAYRQPYAYKN